MVFVERFLCMLSYSACFQWDENYIYLIMEFCSGGDLSQFIRTKRTLSEYVTKKFLQQLGMYYHDYISSWVK